MLAKRIIPCLDVTAGRVVKGTNFVGLRDAGDPVEIARRYDAQGADELTFLDITASSDQRDIILEVGRRQQIKNLADFRDAMKKSNIKQGVTLLVKRENVTFFATLKE